MKIKISAKQNIAIGRLAINAKDLKILDGEKTIKSQWVSFADGGILILETDKCGEYEFDVKVVDKNEINEKSSLDVKFKGAFPDYENITFHDGFYGLVLAEQEKEPWAGKSYKFSYDKNAKIISWSKGEIATVVKTCAKACDENGEPAPESPSVEYTWIFIGEHVLVLSEVSGKVNGRYGYRFLAPKLEGRKKYIGGLPKLENEIKADTGIRLDGFAAETNGEDWCAIYRAGVYILPDFLTAEVVDKGFLSYGNELCSAWLYVGKSKEIAKNNFNNLPTDCLMRIVEEKTEKEYKSGNVSIKFYKTESGSNWQVESGAFASVSNQTVFKVKSDYEEWNSSCGWTSVEFLADKVIFKGRKNNPNATVEVFFKTNDNGLKTSITVKNAQKIGRVCFPCLNVGAQGKVDVLEPFTSGKLEKDILRRDFYYRETYSGPFANMSFVGAINEEGKGFYVCWEGEGERRDYNLNSLMAESRLNISAALWPENMGVADSFSSPEIAVYQTEKGWRGMCSEYRKYAEKACWCTRKNRDPEKKIEENRFYLWAYFRWDDENGKRFTTEESIAEWLSVIEKISKKMDAKLVAMAYDWQATLPLAYRSDVFPEVKKEELTIGAVSDGVTQRANIAHPEIGTNYMPHYLPAKDGFKEAVEKLHKKGVWVMPYIDNRLWDPRDMMLGDFEQNWENTGKRLSCKNEQGKSFMEYYCHHLPDGTAANSAVICPYTEEWQDINVKIVTDLVKDYGVDGVYLDQIAATPPSLCMDASHGHPIGGGTWWREGYDKMLAKMRNEVPTAILTTECEAEPYMADHDAYLTWTHVFPDQVPAYSAVYSDKIIQQGRTPVHSYFSDYPDLDGAHEVRAMCAQSYLFGVQLGWIAMRALLALDDLLIPFLNKLMVERDKLLDYFNHGELVDMPEMQADEELCYRWGRDLRPVVLPRILSTVWKYEGKSKLLLTNPFDKDGVATWSAKKGQFGYGKALKIDGKEYNAEKPFTIEMKAQSVLTLDLEIID